MSATVPEHLPRMRSDHGHPRRWLILLLVIAAESMDLLDSTIVNVASPAIRDSLQASDAALEWIVGGYALSFSVGLITGGRLGDIYGRRRMFLIGAAGFAHTSVHVCFAADPAAAYRPGVAAEPPLDR
jgi:MFS family permease